MLSILEIAYYLSIGACTGLLSGLFGIGGGIITVPALMLIFRHQSIFQTANTMHIAASTTLIVMAMTSLATANAYRRRKVLVWPLFWKVLPGLCLGLACGSAISYKLSNHLLSNLFAIFLIGTAIHLFFDARQRKSNPPTIHSNSGNHNFSIIQKGLLIGGSFIVGNLSTMFGIGGGVLLVPLFLLMHCTLHEAAGTSALCGIVSAVVGTFFLFQLPQPLPALPHTLGNIYWPAAVFIGIASVGCAPLGTRLAFYLKTSLLKQLFSGALLISAWSLIQI